VSEFTSITSVGGLLPSTLLSQVTAGQSDLAGTGAESYGLVPGERLNDHITRSWNRLTGVWAAFKPQLDVLPTADNTATTLTRDRWLRPLFDELGFAGLSPSRAIEIDGKEYPISHDWAGTVPVHQLGARLSIDRRTPGVPGAARSSPHGLVQEYLNRSSDHLWALVTNGRTLRVLRDNASLTRQAFVEFDLEAMFDGELYSDFAALWLVCHRTRFEGDPPAKCFLEQWAQHAATTGTRALDRLREGVEAAIVSLGEGFLAHPANAELRAQLERGSLSTADYQRQLLRVVYRLLFLLVAEARDLLLHPEADGVTRARYNEHYSLSRLVKLARLRRGTTHDDLWDGLQVTIGALWRTGQPALGLAPLGSFLWSPDSVGLIGTARLDNAHLLETLRQLTLVRDSEARLTRSVDYRNLGSEELGSIYESLLEQHAQVDVPARTFSLGVAAGNERKTTGSYYTPTSLINELLDSALDPVLDEAARKPDPEQAILGLSVLDPACGSGHFLIAAANRIALRLASVRAGGIEPAPDEVRAALRDVIGRCIHGIDVNPMAVELCKVSLWMEATEPGKPLSFLDHRIVCGNALLGTTPRLLADGIPDDAYKALDGDDKTTVAALKKRNRSERQGQEVLDLFGGSVGAATRPVAEALAAIDALPDTTAEQIARKEELLHAHQTSRAATHAKLAADAWCAAFVAPKATDEPPITTATVRQLLSDPARVAGDVVARVQELADDFRFLHLHLAFPDVIAVPDDLDTADIPRTGWNGGFSVVLGNPPWERVKLQEKEFFAERDPSVAAASNAAARKRKIAALQEAFPELFAEFRRAVRVAEGGSHFLRTSGRYPLCGLGRDINTASAFAELMRDSMSVAGRAGVIVPSGIATDDTTKFFFQDLVERRGVVSLYDFENRKKLFPGIDSRIKFCLLTLTGTHRPIEEPEFVFFVLDTADLDEPDRRFTLSADDFALFNPNTRTCPIFRNHRDLVIGRAIYGASIPADKAWDLETRPGLFHMGNDSKFFAAEGQSDLVPLLEGKQFWQLDHRFASVECGSFLPTSDLLRLDPNFRVKGRWFVPVEEVRKRSRGTSWFIAWRGITNATNERTVVAAAVPALGIGHSAVVVTPPRNDSWLLLACLSTFALDYAARQKIGGPNLLVSIVQQLPIPRAARTHVLRPLVRNLTVELVYTSWDLAAFVAEDPDLAAPAPYRWMPERRELLRAELDAVFFHLYGIERDDVDYIMDTFPIVRRKDEAQYGEYRTKRLILEVYDRMGEAMASGEPYQTLLDPPPADPSICHDPSTRPEWADLYAPRS